MKGEEARKNNRSLE